MSETPGSATDLSAAIAMVRRLVGFDTVSARSNLDLIRWIADYLDGHGIPARLTYDEGRTKANLFATIGPGETGGVILSGHTDVVPVAGQPWDSDRSRDDFKPPRHQGHQGTEQAPTPWCPWCLGGSFP